MRTCIFFCFLTLVMVYACEPKPEYKYIDENTKMKFHKGDTLTYTSPLRTDTFTISYLEDIYSQQENIYSEGLEIRYRKVNIDSVNDSIFIYDSYYMTQRSKYGIGLYWRNFYGGGSDTSKSTIDTSFVIGNKTIYKVFVFSNESVVEPHFSNDVKRVFYCHFYGVIAYECYSSEMFIMDKKCFDKCN